MICAR